MRVLIAGGGTGGHIYPGIAVAEALFDHDLKNEVLFVASKEGMEKNIIPKFNLRVRYPGARYQIKYISVIRCLRKLSLKSILSPFFALFAVFQSLFIILKFKPQAVLITGGFVGLPVAMAAYLLRVPVILQEQNVVLGVTNKVCSFFAKTVLLAFDESKKYFKSKKGVVVGNPVRKNILTADRATAINALGLSNDKLKILIWGGSQGSKAINEKVVEAAKKGIPEDFEIIHVIGKRDFAAVLKNINANLDPHKFVDLARLSKFDEIKNYYLVDYLDDVSRILAAADLVIGRAGATALAEIIARGLPSILIPFPYAAADHQTLNARVLVDRGAAVMMGENEFKAVNLFEFIAETSRQLEAMAAAVKNMQKGDPALKIIDIMGQFANPKG
ncbi:MAG: undecaprenyldiphospho-muramoylpentapeptide beta-N-acetylglucosaminyltransferase [Candidatus Margulisbacteria bacterium]|nr:undecaprenyldiphospho-muramoylpentapeptide beta-N-acetylglucosaminyltransferase [Candidatus Margulisiibacteriota bacterium]MBU1022570.1 undecaprenyldiphospho-muramoylpentapeptide beta-N-acetylglucosaminyltransferase [Candidatus Margulisiibacteriota bacterium]MBU1728856.1 undecaprenyldiphospho-muramoylpentapeptide beta-N-acetylglucosaminyltransferase [Candidatus Margulisiibacteriota bacterium]MBU1955487.1 undecaprenyldiphospho-muramoylpentapeptide beta-N-acetylglucosaminyltransferase [Candidat